MASTREIQIRRKSIQDTMKITNAMYMISSTKLRKARANLEETEPCLDLPNQPCVRFLHMFQQPHLEIFHLVDRYGKHDFCVCRAERNDLFPWDFPCRV